MMPYDAFLAAAQKAQYDISLLCARFRVSFEQIATRLTSLQRPGTSGIPFFLLEIDIAGNRIRRAGANGYPQARFGGNCPKLNVHSAFSVPGHILAERAEMPDSTQYLLVACTLEGPVAGFEERVRRTALLIGCDAAHAAQTVYGQATDGRQPVGIGTGCRLCERSGCLARAEPPVTRPLGLDEMVAGLSVFDFQ
jgi:predicted transcriptional regulator